MSTLEDKIRANHSAFRAKLTTFLTSVLPEPFELDTLPVILENDLTKDEKDYLSVMIDNGVVGEDTSVLEKIASRVLYFDYSFSAANPAKLEQSYISATRARLVNLMITEIRTQGTKIETELFISNLANAYNLMGYRGFENSEINFDILETNEKYQLYEYFLRPRQSKISVLKPIIRKLHNVPGYITDDTFMQSGVITDFLNVCSYLRFDLEEPTKPNRAVRLE